MKVWVVDAYALLESFRIGAEELARAMNRAATAIAKAFSVGTADTLALFEPYHDWWPINDDEWLRFAGAAFRLRRYRLAWYCVRRGWRAHLASAPAFQRERIK